MAKFYDTLLAEYVKNPGTRWLWLDKLAETELDYQMISYDDVTNKKKLNFKDVELIQAAIYSGEDVYITAKLKQHQDSQNNNLDLLHDIEIPSMQVLKDMEIAGVKVDTEKLIEIWKRLKKEALELRTKIHEAAGEEFNINSPKQVGEILFQKLELPKWKKTKTWWSVSADVLENLASDYPIAKDIVNFRHYSKILSTYVVGISELVDENSLVHTNYNQSVTSTGRLSSTNPNLQNIPASDGIAGEIRWAFVSRFEWWSMMAFDYSQVEVRILAFLSWDENLLWVFQNGRDIHSETWKFIFWSSDISWDQRKIAKAVNFGVIYGISAFWLSKNIDIPIPDARKYIDTFYESYPKVRLFFDTVIKNCERKTYVETYFWRKRFIAWINDRNKMIKSASEREAINMPIQGTSADIIKMAMIEVDVWVKKEKLKSKLIMQVHDELVFDVFPGEEDTLKEHIPKIMENILKTDIISLKVDTGEWKTWKECK
jgi:DNA polymerase I